MSNKAKYTPEQQTAIYDKGKSLLVSAAAGSGKTTVLVQRAMNIICDSDNPVPADSLFIITFTNAAAAELKSRLLRCIDEKMRENGSDGVFLRRQKLLLSRADIGTVDSFCKRLVIGNFNVLDIPADINVAPASKLLELKNEAMAQTVDEMYADGDFAAFAGMFGKSRTDKAAEDMIWQLYGFLSSMPFEKKTLEKMRKAYNETTPLAETEWGRVLLRRAKSAAARALLCMESALGIINREPQLGKYYETLAAEAERTDALNKITELALNGKKSFDEAAECAVETVFGRLPVLKDADETLKEQVKGLREEAKALVKKMRERIFICTEDEFRQDKEALRSGINALCRAVEMFSEKYYQLKIRDKAFDFSDFEHLALRLLCDEDNNRTPLAAELAEKYSVIMVDEYQDTNDLQNMIYECIANEDKSNMFFVGDIKQSIYRFRQANPEIFLRRRKSYAPYDGKNHPSTITLGHNFRSADGVIDAVNDIFSVIMSSGAGDVDYDENEKLYSGTGASLPGADTEIHFVDCAQEDEKDQEYVAKLISDMLESGVQVRGADGLRAAKPDDICILLRSPKDISEGYVSALGRYGIPAYAGSEGNFLQLAELQPLIAVLRVIDNPLLDVPMAAALLSPMFGYTPQRLTELRLKCRNGSLYSALAEGDENDAAFLKKISDWGISAASLPVYRLCDNIIAETGYKAAVGAMPMGMARCENLRRFCEYAKGYTGNGLSGFIRMLDNALEAGISVGETAKTAPEGYVSIMSIHSSKGLEFPICIAAGLYKKFNLRDTSGQLLLHPELGIGANIRKSSSVIYRTVMHEAIAARMKEEALSEEMRVLYVALTRAKDRLIIVNAQPRLAAYIERKCLAVKSGGADAFLMQNAASMGDWITYAALMHPDGNILWECGAVPAPDGRRAQGRLNIITAKAPQINDDEATELFELAENPDRDLVNELLCGFARGQNEPEIYPVKYSVSQLAHKDADLPCILSRPSFMYKSGLSSAEAGTAMHAFLQYADFAAAEKNTDAEIRRLVEQRFIPLSAAESLSEEKIKNFLQSALCREMLAADRLLREYEFIITADAETAQSGGNGEIIVQGVADCVIIKNNKAKLVDYKTDKNKTEKDFITAYKNQLRLYKYAVEQRLGTAVTQCVIYSTELQKEIEIENI